MIVINVPSRKALMKLVALNYSSNGADIVALEFKVRV